jgi:preprotein translocase subunit Sec63
MIGSLLVQCVLSALLPAIIARSVTSAFKLPRTQRNIENIHSAVVALYAAYSLGSAGYTVLNTLNYCRLLGIQHDANPGQLRQRWISLARLYHPDKLGGSEEAQEHFRLLQKANEVLKNDTLRKAYER